MTSILFLCIGFLFPSIGALIPPEVRISDGEIQPLGTVSACSTITTTIGTRVDLIPVPCPSTGSALPSIFTEQVIVGSSSASLVIGPSGDVDFVSQTWLPQPTGIFHPGTGKYPTRTGIFPPSTGKSAVTGISSSIAGIFPPISIPSGSGTGGLSSVTIYQSLSSNTANLATGGISGIATSSSQSGSSTSNQASAGISESQSATQSQGSASGLESSSNAQITSSTTTSSSSAFVGSLSLLGSSTGSNSPSQGLGSHSANATTSQSSIGLGIIPPSQSPSQILGSHSSSGGTSVLTAFPGSLSTAVQSATTTAPSNFPGSSQTSNTAFVPITASASTTLDPIGAIALSSARALQSSIVVIGPLVQSYINTPGDDTSSDAVNALKGILPLAEELSDSIGPGPNPQPCSAGLNLLSDIFNAVKCVAQDVENAITHIEGGLDDIDDLKSDLTDLNGLQQPLDNDSEEDDDNNSTESQPSQSQSQSSASQITTSLSSPSISSATSSSGSCLYPSSVTLPPDSLTGPSQPSQPTSVVVTGLPSVDSIGISGRATGESTSSPSPSTVSPILPPISSIVTSSGSNGAPPPALPTSSPAITSVPASSTMSTPFCQNNPVDENPPNCVQPPTSSLPLSCSAGSNVGLATYNPATWCGCNTNSGTLYPTMTSGTGDAACAYSTNPESTVSPTIVTSTAAAGPTPSCVSASTLPTGVPQNLVASNISDWCSDVGSMGQGVGCDNTGHGGFWLSSSCVPILTSVALQYYYPDITMYLNISIASGAQFTINQTECNNALGIVLNGCPPFSGSPLIKYGGSVLIPDGAGNVGNFHIDLISDPGDPGNQPGDPGTK